MTQVQILFEDESILIVNKPSGIVVHPFDHSTEETLLDFLTNHIPGSFGFGNTRTLQDGRTFDLGGIVHKLDRDTSGVMVIAKTKEAYVSLKESFSSHNIKKEYVAIIEGEMREDSFTINASLGRNKKEYKQSVNPINPRGELRQAITEVTLITRDVETSTVTLRPLTGRTHQLRAHMAHLGHPILGDKAYGSILPSERIMLHAKTLSFTLFGKDHTFTAPSSF